LAAVLPLRRGVARRNLAVGILAMFLHDVSPAVAAPVVRSFIAMVAPFFRMVTSFKIVYNTVINIIILIANFRRFVHCSRRRRVFKSGK
jgi:hypothetical protein